MRSASLPHVKQIIQVRWRPTVEINKDVVNAKKSVAARYLQLELGTRLLKLTSRSAVGIDEGSGARCCGECARKRSLSARDETEQIWRVLSEK